MGRIVLKVRVIISSLEGFCCAKCDFDTVQGSLRFVRIDTRANIFTSQNNQSTCCAERSGRDLTFLNQNLINLKLFTAN